MTTTPPAVFTEAKDSLPLQSPNPVKWGNGICMGCHYPPKQDVGLLSHLASNALTSRCMEGPASAIR